MSANDRIRIQTILSFLLSLFIIVESVPHMAEGKKLNFSDHYLACGTFSMMNGENNVHIFFYF